MATKFKVGDTVQVVKDTIGGTLNSEFKVGHRGTVIAYKREYAPESYQVRRKTNEHKLWFNVKELKLIRKGK